MKKPRNPYTDLLEECRSFAHKVGYRRRIGMWTYPMEKLGTGWHLRDLWDRVAAAKSLGYDVELSATEKGLVVEYVAKLPSAPWRLQ